MGWVHHLVEVLVPPVCRVCRRSGTFPLCRGCITEFRLISPPWCRICGRPLRRPDSAAPCTMCRIRAPSFSRARSAGIYEGALREAIHSLKFGGCRPIADPLGELVASAVQADRLRAHVVVPVPLHPSRLRQRGFNQAELLGRRVARVLGVPCDAGVLRRRYPTGAQSHLTRDARAANVRGKFAGVRSLDGCRVLLVDDVMSTGFTASECARALLAAGAQEVAVATVARTVLTEGGAAGPERAQRAGGVRPQPARVSPEI